jgi:hypothetical protein
VSRILVFYLHFAKKIHSLCDTCTSVLHPFMNHMLKDPWSLCPLSQTWARTSTTLRATPAIDRSLPLTIKKSSTFSKHCHIVYHLWDYCSLSFSVLCWALTNFLEEHIASTFSHFKQKMEAIHTSEIMVTTYQTMCQNQEYCIMNHQCHNTLELYIYQTIRHHIPEYHNLGS